MPMTKAAKEKLLAKSQQIVEKVQPFGQYIPDEMPARELLYRRSLFSPFHEYALTLSPEEERYLFDSISHAINGVEQQIYHASLLPNRIQPIPIYVKDLRDKELDGIRKLGTISANMVKACLRRNPEGN